MNKKHRALGWVLPGRTVSEMDCQVSFAVMKKELGTTFGGRKRKIKKVKKVVDIESEKW